MFHGYIWILQERHGPKMGLMREATTLKVRQDLELEL